jgi:hypothetical protein
MMMENLVEWRLAGETEVRGENLPQRHVVHHKSHLPDPGSNPGRCGGKPATNRLSYGAAYLDITSFALKCLIFLHQWLCKDSGDVAGRVGPDVKIVFGNLDLIELAVGLV